MAVYDIYDIKAMCYSADAWNESSLKYNKLVRIHYLFNAKTSLVKKYGFTFKDIEYQSDMATIVLNRLDDMIVNQINNAELSDKAKVTNRLTGRDIDKFYKAIFEDFEYADLLAEIADTFIESEYHKIIRYLITNPDNIDPDIVSILTSACNESNPLWVNRQWINEDIKDMIPEENRS